MTRRFLIVLTLLGLGGCASFPDELQVPEGTQLTGYKDVAQQPEIAKDTTARWGGVIAGIKNLKDHTLLEVVHYPLRNYGRPVVEDQSFGRFRVYVKGFLDPLIYEKGRSITVLGKVKGVEQGKVDEHEYIYPSLEASQHHLWKNVQRVEIQSLNMWPYYPYYGWPHRAHYPFYRSSIYIKGKSPTLGVKPKPVKKPVGDKR